MTLLEQCNADVYKEILEMKSIYPDIGEQLITVLQKYQHWFDMTGLEMLLFSANLSTEIWNGKVHYFHLLFQSQQTTKMP
jgi:hypothetical protein